MKVNFTNLKSEFFELEKNFIYCLKKIGKNGDYILGKELKIFENKIKKFLNVKYVLGVGNWTEGMSMVCKALNLNSKDEIITVSNSFIATCGAISYAGCKPIYVDTGYKSILSNEDLPPTTLRFSSLLEYSNFLLNP